MNSQSLQTSIEYLKGVGPNRAQLLASELDIHCYQDLLHLFPNRYIDRTQFYKINQLQDSNAEMQIVGQITHLKTVSQKKGSRLVATFKDETGSMEMVWFRGQKWIRENLKLGIPYVAFGKVNRFDNRFSMPHPEMELVSEYKNRMSKAMQPIYPSTEKLTNRGITNRVIIKLQEELFRQFNAKFNESLSEEILKEVKLISKSEALINIHFPKNQELLTKARYRLKFEELFFIQLQLVRKNLIHKSQIKGFNFEIIGKQFHTFYQQYLPFELTSAQKKVIREIRADMGSGAQMNRLLQGDVGSGKTIVAFMSMIIAIDNGFQACMMAPTEILSVQHYNGLMEWCNNLNISIFLLTGSTNASKKDEKYIKNWKMEK